MRLALLSLFLLGLAGCTGAFDPWARPGNWSARGAPMETIAQQAANKGDLIQGHGQASSNGVAASSAIDTALGANGIGTGAGLQKPIQPTTISTSISTSGS